jgi:hypothetical protein
MHPPRNIVSMNSPLLAFVFELRSDNVLHDLSRLLDIVCLIARQQTRRIPNARSRLMCQGCRIQTEQIPSFVVIVHIHPGHRFLEQIRRKRCGVIALLVDTASEDAVRNDIQRET